MIGRGTSHSTAGQVARFLVVGATNTLLTYALFLLLAQWIDASVAYSIAFFLGLAYTTVLSSRWVFGADASARRIGLFIAWYLLIWLLGLTLVHLIAHGGFERHLLAAAAVLCVTTPLNFVGGRFILHRPQPPVDQEVAHA